MTLDAALAAARDHARAGRFADAERVLRDALVGQATRADALSDLAMCVGQQGRLAESESLLAQAVALDPGFIPARLNLAVALARQGNLAGAADVLRQARDILPPGDITWWRRLAQLHARLGQPEDGLSAVATALAIDPNDAEAIGVRASLLLLAGDFPRGWAAYEARWRIGQRAFGRRDWSDVDLDTADPRGARVAVVGEQGFGDVIQFARYAPLLAGWGARVTFVCAPDVHSVVRWIPGVAAVTSDPAVPADYVFPAMSLPRLFRTMLETIPATVPYVTPPAPVADKWRARLAAHPGLKVGITWAGNPAHKGDADRSIRLERFAPLAAVPGITLFSLQKGPASAQANPPPPGMSVVNLTAGLADFADTAGLVSALDLVVSVDTAVVHLAGAMAKDVWTLLPLGPDFRWLTGRADSPWYPTMRLFRQRALGDWDAVIRDVAAALAERAKRK